MSLLDFLAPEVSGAQQLRRIANNMERQQRIERVKKQFNRTKRKRDTHDLQNRVAALEKDLGQVTLVLAAVLDIIQDKGVVSTEDVQAAITAIDKLDGELDGATDVSHLREITQTGNSEP